MHQLLHLSKKYCYLTLLMIVSSVSFAVASTATGTIDATYHYARVCHDSSCGTYGTLNFLPTVTGTSTTVVITDTGLSGYLWGDEIGWVNLSPTGAGVSINPLTGVLSGNAFSQVSGFVNFSPTNGGVTINGNGEFTGYAWAGGLNGGWIKFDCAISSTCVKTDWRTISVRNATQTPPAVPIAGSGGSNSPSYFIDASFSPYTYRTTTESVIVTTINQTSLPITQPSNTSNSGAIFRLDDCPLPQFQPVMGDNSSTITLRALTRGLSRGIRSPEVAVLQAFLAEKEYFFPKESVTGYFGPLTERAVKCFQLKYQIAGQQSAGFGYVGPLTRAQIKLLLP